MNMPPQTLDGAEVFLWVTRREPIHFIPEGDVRHPVMAMAICGYIKSGKGVYLFKCDGTWEVIQDAPCNSVEGGVECATQWGVRRQEWKRRTAAGGEAVWVDGLSIIDQKVFASRGANGCSNSDFRPKRTSCCGSVGVEDEELIAFYFDPTDLTRTIDLFEGCVCPFCGASDFGLTEIKAPAEVPNTWRWACRSEIP